MNAATPGFSPIKTFALVFLGLLVGRVFYVIVGQTMKSEPERPPLVITTQAPLRSEPVSYSPDGQPLRDTSVDEKLRSLPGKDQKAAYAMGALYGFYISNTWAIEDYCKSYGVQIPAFIAAFRDANQEPYRLAKNVLFRLDLGPEGDLYNKEAPIVFAKVRELNDSANANLHITPAQGCQSLQDHPQEAVARALFSKTHPLEMAVLENSQS